MDVLLSTFLWLTLVIVEAYALYWTAHQLGGGWFPRVAIPHRLVTAVCLVLLTLTVSAWPGWIFIGFAYLAFVMLVFKRRRHNLLVPGAISTAGKVSNPIQTRMSASQAFRRAFNQQPDMLLTEVVLSLLMMVFSLATVIVIGFSSLAG